MFERLRNRDDHRTAIIDGSGAADPDSSVGTSAVWNLPLILSPACPKGTFLVGAFMQATILFDREVLTVEISYENEDDFIHNLACFRGELRCCAAAPLPQGLMKGSFPSTSIMQTKQPPAPIDQPQQRETAHAKK